MADVSGSGGTITLVPDLAASLAASEAVHMAVIENAEKILALAKDLCPVRTGALQSSGRIEMGESQAAVIFGNAEVDYAGYVEFGTIDTPAFAFLRRAGEAIGGRTYYRDAKGRFATAANAVMRF